MWGLAPRMDDTSAAAALWETGNALWQGGDAAGHGISLSEHTGNCTETSAAGQHSAAAKVYVQGLPQSLQHPVAVAGLFSPFGDVLDVKLYAAEVRLSGGSAVVRMRSTTQAAAAIAALNGVVPDGGWQQLTVRAAETAEQRSSRINAINGRQQGSGTSGPIAPRSPQQPLAQHASLPPPGPGTAAVLRRVHSARGAGSHGSLHSYTGALTASDLMLLTTRRSADGWAGSGSGGSAGTSGGGRSSLSLDGSRRSSMDTLRTPLGSSEAGSASGGGGGGGGPIDDLPLVAAAAAAGEAHLPTPHLQRMLLEAVLALVAQVESGQLSLGAMRLALEAALGAATQASRLGAEDSLPSPRGGDGGATNLGRIGGGSFQA